MHTGKGTVVELTLENGLRHARISCSTNLIPSPGQYLLAGAASQSDPLPAPLFSTESTSQGFTACAPIPETWTPGTEITLRGPLGRGFALPPSARNVALVAFDDIPARLLNLMKNALGRDAAVVLVCNSSDHQLPDEVEIQPLSALSEACEWADYAAFDVARENLPGLKQMLGGQNQKSVGSVAQALIRTLMPCGGIADCGVCALTLKSNWKMICKDGPVFDWDEI